MDITLLDGSIGQELVHRLGAKPTPLWSTSVMLENPDLVGDVHTDYFKAGADVATTNTYAILPDRLAQNGMGDRIDELVSIAIEQAVRSRDAHGTGRIAGSLGPMGASYRTDFDHSLQDAVDGYSRQIESMSKDADFFLAETVSSLNQTRNLVHAVGELTDKPLWLALSVDDDDGTKLRSGEALVDAAELLSDQVAVVLINCSRPEAVSVAMPILAGFGLPFGAYANGFTKISAGFLEHNPTVDALSARQDLGPAEYADFAQQWVDTGATIVGGCCEVGPDHIVELRKRFK